MNNVSPVTQVSGQAVPRAVVGWELFVTTAKAYLATTPGRLRAWQVGGMAVALLLALVVTNFDSYLTRTTRLVTKDTVPSIVAAEKLRNQLAVAHSEMTNVFLDKETGEGVHWRAYKAAILAAQQSTLEAAQNITNGDAERAPILTIMTSLDEYERLVGAAHEQGYGPDVEAADNIMQSRLLPAAQALDKANFDVLDSEYNAVENTSKGRTGLMYLAAIGLAAYLLGAQRYLSVTFRRRVNYPLAAVSATTAVGMLAFVICVHFVHSDLRIAERDAFQSIHAMWKSKATIAEANADEALFLLESKDPNRQAAHIQDFNRRASDIDHVAPDGKLAGFLGDELNNVTFAGEDVLAQKAAKNWKLYLAVDARIRQLEQSGKHDAAVALNLSTAPGDSDWAYDQFDKAADEVAALNQSFFDTYANKARRAILVLELAGLLTAVALAVGTFLGFKARLDEYHF